MSPLFLLSPANGGGVRAGWLLRHDGRSELAGRLRDRGAPIGEVYAFVSGLYFRGKLTYARAFAAPGDTFVITPSDGLWSPDDVLDHATFARFSRGEVDPDRPGYRRPLLRDLRALPPDRPVVLLGSIATRKYLEPLASVLGDRLHVPPGFVGLGDMSRGAILLRAARDGVPLAVAPARDVVPALLAPKGKRARACTEPARG